MLCNPLTRPELQGASLISAEAFYAEMGDLILPALRKLEDALQGAGEGTSLVFSP